MYSAYKLNKQGDNIQPWRTPFPIWNQSIVPCPVLTVASWPAYKFLKRQIRWSGIPISFRIFWIRQPSAFLSAITQLTLNLTAIFFPPHFEFPSANSLKTAQCPATWLLPSLAGKNSCSGATENDTWLLPFPQEYHHIHLIFFFMVMVHHWLFIQLQPPPPRSLGGLFSRADRKSVV